MTDETAKAILDKLPDTGKFSHRIYHYQTDWDDIDIGSYADLQQMATFWLMRDEIIAEMNDAGASAHGYRQTFYDLLDKITAIAGESKDGKRD